MFPGVLEIITTKTWKTLQSLSCPASQMSTKYQEKAFPKYSWGQMGSGSLPTLNRFANK